MFSLTLICILRNHGLLLTVAQMKNGINPDDKSTEMASLTASGATA
jgi:hypothetical protein